MSVIADNYSAPNDRSFERSVKDECNSRLERLAVTSVLQVDSRATEGLQLVDLMLGAVAFTFKSGTGAASSKSLKARLAQHVVARLGIVDFDAGYASGDVNVRVYEHDRWLIRRGSLKTTSLERPSP